MNYGIFKDGRFLSRKDDQLPRRSPEPPKQRKIPARRLGCVTLLLPLLVLILYLMVRGVAN